MATDLESNSEPSQTNSKNTPTKDGEATQSTLSRRSALKASGIGALGLLGIDDGSIINLTGRRTRIVAARAGTKARAIHTKKVPKKWLKHQEAVRKVTAKLGEIWMKKPFVGSVSYVATDRMQDGVFYSEPEIAVRPHVQGVHKSKIPDSIKETGIDVPSGLVGSDIRIRTMNGEVTPFNVDCYRGVTIHPFTGGLEIRDANSNAIGTSGCRATDGSNNFLYTANHVVANSCRIGKSGVNDARGNRLGRGVDGHKTHDWVMVNDNSTLYSDTIRSEEKVIGVYGYATQNGMESIQGQRGTLQSQGIISGYQDAYVKGGGSFVYSGCIKMFGSGTKLGTPDYVRSGDSGGPFWWPTSSGNHVVTVLSVAETRGSYRGCGLEGQTGRPSYGYPFWRVANNTPYTIT